MTLTHGHTTTSSPPLSRAARLGAGACLIAAGLTNGLGQYVGELLTPDLADFSAQIRWGADHPAVHTAEQTALLVSMLALPLGLLGLANVTRWAAPRLTAVGIVLTLWGMWGFHNVVALGYAAGTVGPGAIGTDSAVALNEGFLDHLGTTVTALLPHLLGSFLGLMLLAIAGLRSVSLPRAPLVLLIAFLVWDFLLPSVGPLEPHLLLAVALVWLGVALVRMPQAEWADPGHETAAGPILAG
ncbi:hypothetical protein IEZ26_01485 [Nocardioides cavernae]|uniref:DUF4386 family protein n=1 Tax=Nocardioides cavernae TaxID=1921566 RepID=A0ABR8N548_9ACTN|nr:hypothetical protein [Nocardioides cavernae]MBD3923278.1 hypothetical protein [Nocardioides cavernae]MBM7511800.1 hypothetical protein [Nocardioides cavernae]